MVEESKSNPLERIEEILDEMNRANKKENRKQTFRRWTANLKRLPPIAQTLTTIKNELKSTLTAGLRLQERGLARGTDLAGIMKTNAGALQAFSGKLTSQNTVLEQQFSLMAHGLTTNNRELSQAAIFTKVTQKDSKKFIAGMAKLTLGMKFSDEQLSNLALNTLNLSKSYGVTTTELVDAVASLGEQLDVYAAMGIGPEMEEAGMALAGALGPSLAALGPQVLGSLTKGSNLIQASLLGVQEERTALLKGEGDTTRLAFDMVRKAGEASQDIIDRFTSASKLPAFMMEEVIKRVYGPEIVLYSKAVRAMEDQARRLGRNTEQQIAAAKEVYEVNEEFIKTWSNLKGIVLTPLQRVATDFLKAVTKLVDNPEFMAFAKNAAKIAAGLGIAVAGAGATRSVFGALGGGGRGAMGLKAAGVGTAGAAAATKGLGGNLLKAAKFAGKGTLRFLPGVGWVMLAYDVMTLGNNMLGSLSPTKMAMNSIPGLSSLPPSPRDPQTLNPSLENRNWEVRDSINTTNRFLQELVEYAEVTAGATTSTATNAGQRPSQVGKNNEN